MTFRGKPWAPTTTRTCPATLNPPHRPGPPARCQAQRGHRGQHHHDDGITYTTWTDPTSPLITYQGAA